jgi:hypothetical protein
VNQYNDVILGAGESGIVSFRRADTVARQNHFARIT